MPQTDDPGIFLRLDELIRVEDSGKIFHTLQNAREVKNHWLIKLEGISDIDEAKSLKGEALYTTEDQIRPLDEDEFFIHDLIDAEVFSTEGRHLGRIVNYFDAGTQGVCEVESESGSFLFPTSDEILKDVKPDGKVVIQLIPELITLNRKKAK